MLFKLADKKVTKLVLFKTDLVFYISIISIICLIIANGLVAFNIIF